MLVLSQEKITRGAFRPRRFPGSVVHAGRKAVLENLLEVKIDPIVSPRNAFYDSNPP